jgi:hypothetical protein
MKKFLTILFLTVALLFSASPAHALTGVGKVDKVLEDTTEGNTKFSDGDPNVTGLQGHIVDTTLTQAVLCNFHENGCTGDPSQPAPVKGFTGFFVALYTPPANTQMYVADLMNSAGLNIAQPAYAQGLGFAALDPILDTWKVFRNVAYLFYVILFLIIGFAIMFRQKISDQAAVTAQQALPKIVVSLIAVTFSYAIAGLLIDFMYISMYLILGLFPNQTFGSASDSFSLRDVALDKNIFEVGALLLTKAGTLTASYNAVRDIVAATFETFNERVASVLGVISGITFAVVFAIATLFGLFRLFFELLKTYISIIITIVLSPIALMLGALPGRNALGAWLKTLVANLAVFPGILIILTLAFMLIGNAYSGPNNVDFFSGEYSGGFLPPYIPGSGSGNAISVMLGLGVILILPDLAASIKKTLGGSGGIFEQFANNFTSAVEKGWKGGELVPGVGLSDTRNWLGKQTGGLSGENIMRKGAIGATAAGRSLAGGYGQLGMKGLRASEEFVRRRSPALEKAMPKPIFDRNYSVTKGMLGRHVEDAAKWTGGKLGDKQINDEKKH